MYEQIREDSLFTILYSAVTTMALLASCYLMLRRANAIAPHITTPQRLRWWTGVFFASIAVNHLWYMPIFFLSSSDDILTTDLVGALLDSLTIIPLAIVVLLAMLQDRRRPLWPVAVMVMPIAVGNAWSVATRSYALLPILYVYFLLIGIGLSIYMVHALKQYGRWLRDNFADLEHKEVWQSFVVLAAILLVFAIYVFTSKGPVYQYAMQVIYVILICYLLWRVETLSDLSIPANVAAEEIVATEHEEDNALSLSIRNNIGPLLQKYCEEPQLYLQYDISVTQLAQQIGINRSYLSKHFALQGISYNAYINGLRVQHFVNLYHESVAKHQPVSIQQLAHQSGFRSYSTFNSAFKQSMGMTATEWMNNVAE